MKRRIIFIFLFLIVFIFIGIISIKIKDSFGMPSAKKEDILKYNISQIVDSTELFDINVYLPVTQFDNLNVEIEHIINEYIEDFKAQLIYLSTDKKYFLDITFDVYQNKQYISFLFNIKQNLGCLHYENYIYTINYDIKSNKVIKLEDLILKNENLLSDMSKFCYNALVNKEEIKAEENMEFIVDGTLPITKNYETFVINQNTLDIYFGEYEVVPYYLGIQKVEIPYEQINLNI